MSKALLLEDPHKFADEGLKKNGLEVERYTGALDEDELIEALRDVEVLGVRSKTVVTERVLRACPDLRAIGAYCIGTNQIALDAASECGVAVFNAPYANTRSVVELALSEIIALARRLVSHNENLHEGLWDKSAAHSHEVRGQTLGIIGYGSIGTQLSVLAEALGMHVVFFDIEEKLALGNARRMNSLEEVLAVADIVSIHVNGAEANTDLFGDAEFRAMKPGANFINLSRGFIVDIDALKKHLESGHLGGAAIDVYPMEPKNNGDSFTSPLLGVPNVILTPHIGGSTLEAQESIGRFVSGKLADYMTSGNTSMSVNLPSLAPPIGDKATWRVCLLHTNIPGVMADLNRMLAAEGVNVEGQGLSTKGSEGYAIADIDSPLSIDTVRAIADFEATIRLRTLPLKS